MKNIILIFFLFITSCSTNPPMIDVEDDFTTYGIKQGEHSSGNHISLTLSKKIECLVVLTETCIYDLNSDDQGDINKLFGLSDSYNHSDHSARFGWRYFNNRIEILSYVRRDGNFYYEFIGVVEPNQINVYKIEILEDKYRFYFNKKILDMDRTSKYSGIRYKLYPYFGGNNFAPHNVFIKIKFI